MTTRESVELVSERIQAAKALEHLPAEILAALHKLVEGLAHYEVNWALTGSTSLALQGVPVRPNDIDLQSDEAGAFWICEIFSEYVVEEPAWKASERIQSFLGQLDVEGVQVEVMGAVQKHLPDNTWEAPVDIEKRKRFVEVDGLQAPVLDLNYEQAAYTLMGRAEKAALLAAWLVENKA